VSNFRLRLLCFSARFPIPNFVPVPTRGLDPDSSVCVCVGCLSSSPTYSRDSVPHASTRRNSSQISLPGSDGSTQVNQFLSIRSDSILAALLTHPLCTITDSHQRTPPWALFLHFIFNSPFHPHSVTLSLRSQRIKVPTRRTQGTTESS